MCDRRRRHRLDPRGGASTPRCPAFRARGTLIGRTLCTLAMQLPSELQQLAVVGHLEIHVRKPVEHLPAEMREQQALRTQFGKIIS
jgi:hypothetical protein